MVWVPNSDNAYKEDTLTISWSTIASQNALTSAPQRTGRAVGAQNIPSGPVYLQQQYRHQHDSELVGTHVLIATLLYCIVTLPQRTAVDYVLIVTLQSGPQSAPQRNGGPMYLQQQYRQQHHSELVGTNACTYSNTAVRTIVCTIANCRGICTYSNTKVCTKMY